MNLKQLFQCQTIDIAASAPTSLHDLIETTMMVRKDHVVVDLLLELFCVVLSQ